MQGKTLVIENDFFVRCKICSVPREVKCFISRLQWMHFYEMFQKNSPNYFGFAGGGELTFRWDEPIGWVRICSDGQPRNQGGKSCGVYYHSFPLTFISLFPSWPMAMPNAYGHKRETFRFKLNHRLNPRLCTTQCVAPWIRVFGAILAFLGT